MEFGAWKSAIVRLPWRFGISNIEHGISNTEVRKVMYLRQSRRLDLGTAQSGYLTASRLKAPIASTYSVGSKKSDS
jgi:hypothetical protein